MNGDGKTQTKKRKMKKLLQIFWIGYVIFSFIYTSYWVDSLIKSGFKDKSIITHLDDNWDITINDKVYKNVSLEEFTFDTVTVNDVIEMRNTLPNDWDYEDAVMCFHTRQASVDMYVDNELAYEYGHERVKNNETVGSGLLFISMFDEYKGKDIKIVLTVSEMDAFSQLDEVWMSEWHDSYRYVITENRFPMFIGFFFVIFGILIAIIGVITILLSIKNVDVFFLSVFSIMIGLWTLCYYNCTILFTLPLYSISLMEHMCLLLAPLPFIGYMNKYVKIIDKKFYTITYKIITALQIVLSLILIVCHSADIVHAARGLSYSHITVVILTVFFARVIYLGMKKNRNSKKADKLIIAGLTTVGLCIGYELVVYISNRYYGVEIPSIPGLATIGIIILVVMFIIDLWYSVTDKLMEEQEKAILLEKTYIDELTSINNRRYCSEYMRKIAKKNAHYSVICFDLNGLKKINDTYGHIKGDMLIKKAASVIAEAFSESGIVGRMGGDEFISIINTINNDEIENLITKFNKLLEENNKVNEDGLELSIAMGYASCKEVEDSRNIEKVYNLADSRMYGRKKEMKKHLD